MRWNAHVVLALCGLPVMVLLIPGIDPLADGLVVAVILCLAAMLPDFDRVEGLDQVPGYLTGVWRRTLAGCGVLYPLFLVARYVNGWRPDTPDLQLMVLLLVLVVSAFVSVLPIAGAAVALIEGIPVIVPVAFVIGFASHALADALTPSGVYPLYPISKRRVSLSIVRTGAWGEHAFTVAFFLVFLGLILV